LAAADLAKYKVRVNAVVPGFIATSIFGGVFGMDRDGAEQLAAVAAEKGADMQPAVRIGRPDDIAEAVLYLASDAAGFVTGTHLLVDGGLTIGTRASWDPQSPPVLLQLLGLTSEQARAMRVARP
jgi:NAD(P)-dependent dehydrogenase (short-subunit alcohol dehydrogenase family)